MNLLYDLSATQPSGDTQFHGGGEYASVVFQHLIFRNTKGANVNVIAFYNDKNWINPYLLHFAQANGVTVATIQRKYDIENLIKEHSIQRFYSALPYNYYDLDLGNVEFIYTIHGLRALEMPTDKYEIVYAVTWRDRMIYTYKQLFKKRYIDAERKAFQDLLRLPQTTRIIVPSEHTKYSLLSKFSFIPSGMVKILYSPRTSIVEMADENILRNYGVEKNNFFLLISANRWLKNSFRAMLAFDRLFTVYPNLDYKVLILGLGREKLLNRLMHKVKNQERFQCYGYVEREHLERLYQDAFCFLYPTLNEGFGYPPLDCMKYGTPVIASAITSVTEICSDGVIYCSPTSIDEIISRIFWVISSIDTYNKYSQKGIKVCKKINLKQDQMLDQLVNELIQ